MTKAPTAVTAHTDQARKRFAKAARLSREIAAALAAPRVKYVCADCGPFESTLGAECPFARFDTERKHIVTEAK
jgi:methionine synthase I (cobalamin-dependent)